MLDFLIQFANFLKLFKTNLKKQNSQAKSNDLTQYIIKTKIEENFFSLKLLFKHSKVLFLKPITKNIEELKESKIFTCGHNQYITKYIKDDCLDIHTFLTIMGGLKNQLQKFLLNYSSLQACNKKCFNNLGFLQGKYFMRELNYLDLNIKKNNLQNYLNFIIILTKVLNKPHINYNNSKFYPQIKYELLSAHSSITGLGQVELITMVESLHLNFVKMSLQRRIKFNVANDIKQDFRTFAKKFKKQKVLADPHKKKLESYISNLISEIEYHNLNDVTYPHLKPITLQILQLLEEFKNYHLTLSIVKEVFETRSKQKVNLLKMFQEMQNRIWKNIGINKIMKSKKFKLFESTIISQIDSLKKKLLKNCSQTFVVYIQQVIQALIKVQKIWNQIKNELGLIEKWEDYIKEYELEIRFMNTFKQYLKAIRENVIFIYPYKYNPDYFRFPGICIQYTSFECPADIFDKYCSQHFSLSLMHSYKELFYSSPIKSYLNYKRIELGEFDAFSSLGPLELVINFQLKAPPSYEITGNLICPPNINESAVETDIFLKGEMIKKITDTTHQEDFKFDVFEIMYPFGIYMISKTEGCYDKVVRGYFNGLKVDLGRQISFLPTFEEGILLKIQMKWIKSVDNEDQFTDLDTHVDIHKPDGNATAIHVFNSHETFQNGLITVREGLDGDAFGSDGFEYSEINIHKDFDFNQILKVYLYAYIGDFSLARAQVFIYHRFEGCIEIIKSPPSY